MQTLRSPRLARWLCVGLIGLHLNLLSHSAWADAVSDSAAQAQQLGRQVLQAFPDSQPHKTLQDIFPDSGKASTITLEQVFGNDTATVQLGLEANARLKDEQSEEGEAYRTMIQSANRVSPDLSNDPMFRQADEVRSTSYMDAFNKFFSDCSKQEVFENATRDTHIAKYRTCERLVDQGGTVDFIHDYSAGVIEYDSGQPNYQSCGEGCLYVWVGTVGDNYWNGKCRIFEEYTRFRVVAKEAIQSAVIEYAAFDDYFEVYFNDQMLWTHTPGVFPPETKGKCERNTSWKVNPNTDVTSVIKNSGEYITFKTRTSVTGEGEGYARIKITYDPTKAVIDNGWGPQDRLPIFGMINDGFCSNTSMVCTSMPEKDSQGCITENGVLLCPGNMPASPHPDIDPFCKRATVSAECSFYKGQMACYTDAQGVERCPQNEGGNLNTCREYEQNSSCGFISQKCIEGAQGPSGQCYAFEEVWDCGYDVSVPTLVNTGVKYECPGPVNCMGGECFDTSNTKSTDFAYAVAMLQAAQFAEHDLECGGEGTDVSESNVCKVFKGEGMECKKALGGYVDCCEAPEGISIIDYVRLTMATLKMASAVEALSDGRAITRGYWYAVQNAIFDGAYKTIKGEWSSVLNTATGAFDDTLEGTYGVSAIQGFLMEQTYNVMVELGATEAANAIFQPATTGGMQLTSQAAAFTNFVSMAYTAYVMTDLMIKVIWACEPKEFELDAKKETRQCSYVGSYCASEVLGVCVEKREAYCCFGSVVGRIIQEQGRAQLGMDFGKAKHPSCEGLTVEQLNQIDWAQIDLSEWIGMLYKAGNLDTPDTATLENLTGSGSSLGSVFQGTTRQNSLNRNLKRLEGVDVDQVKSQAEKEIQGNIFQ
ncbi:conjugal transfer mating pair stabilization protein TraN [Azotobacter beijerinckii]|uniref:Conjugal transfer mating pair stabilization protein TraN n=1 Tax=Azotobacter beijerinckii TaxID=170623 RepID=A0A1H6WD91_9GAMM|nr:conjugal transfer mating pair stabilization protein TraN [Azotobacter beijerinckii]SEJ12067.1 conjugal transfer mating pair stabilization protein TraN [Azotobacter beijerinckii]